MRIAQQNAPRVFTTNALDHAASRNIQAVIADTPLALSPVASSASDNAASIGCVDTQ